MRSLKPTHRVLSSLAITTALLAGCGGNSFSSGSGGSGGDAGNGGSGAQGGTASNGGSAGAGANGGSAGAGANGGSAGAGANGGNGGTGGVLPDECRVETSLVGPYGVTFMFINKDEQNPSYLQEDCQLHMSVTSCADGYKSALNISADCTADCENYDGCIACGACPFGYTEVTPQSSASREWSGNTYQFGTTSDGCSCHDTFQAPAGKYRVDVPVYAGPDPDYNETPAFMATTEFTLPAENNIVYVDVSMPWAAN